MNGPRRPLTLCDDHGQCAIAAPKVFRMNDDGRLEYDTDFDDACSTRSRKPPTSAPPGDPAAGPTDRVRTIVVAGASIGGLRAAEQLRAQGFSGDIRSSATNRTCPTTGRRCPRRCWPRPRRRQLRKRLCIGLAFRQRKNTADVTWRLGNPSLAADLAAHTLTLDDGSSVGFDGLVIATGLRPRAARPGRPPTGGPPRHAQPRRRHGPAHRTATRPPGRGGRRRLHRLRNRSHRTPASAQTCTSGANPRAGQWTARWRRTGRRRCNGCTKPTASPCTPGSASPNSSPPPATGTSWPVAARRRPHRGGRLVVVEAVGSHANTEWLRATGWTWATASCDEHLRVVAPEAGSSPSATSPAFRTRCLGERRPDRVEHWSTPTDTAKRRRPGARGRAARREPGTSPSPRCRRSGPTCSTSASRAFGSARPTPTRILEGDLDRARGRPALLARHTASANWSPGARSNSPPPDKHSAHAVARPSRRLTWHPPRTPPRPRKS